MPDPRPSRRCRPPVAACPWRRGMPPVGVPGGAAAAGDALVPVEATALFAATNTPAFPLRPGTTAGDDAWALLPACCGVTAAFAAAVVTVTEAPEKSTAPLPQEDGRLTGCGGTVASGAGMGLGVRLNGLVSPPAAGCAVLAGGANGSLK
jgi:hypothetical protein